MTINQTNIVTKNSAQPFLFLPLPDTDFRDYLEEVARLADSYPAIITAIESDLDAYALEKKKRRIVDQQFIASQTASLEGLEYDADGDSSAQPQPQLQTGRPRISPYLVFVFSMLRGFLGSLASKQAQRFMHESISFYDFLANRGFSIPALTTVIENVNLISAKTQELIFSKQIEYVLEETLDDFKELTIDSTAVHANSSWPTDSKTLIHLIDRILRIGQKLNRFELSDFAQGHVSRWIEEMRAIEFTINLVSGKLGAARKRKKLYKKLLKKGEQAIAALQKEFDRKAKNLPLSSRIPSEARQIEVVVEQLSNDLTDSRRVIDYTKKRIFEDETLPAKEKILSLSDGSAAYISKGGREPVIGYKPQLIRSANGFVADITVPLGNAADSTQLVPCVERAIARSGITADLVSSDDGYSSTKGMNQLIELGIPIVSISGSKGKKITPPELWDSDSYKQARNNRSAVESLMFTLKDGYDFGCLGRRGIEAVRSELKEKVLAYNFCRIILIRDRKAKAQLLQRTG